MRRRARPARARRPPHADAAQLVDAAQRDEGRRRRRSARSRAARRRRCRRRSASASSPSSARSASASASVRGRCQTGSLTPARSSRMTRSYSSRPCARARRHLDAVPHGAHLLEPALAARRAARRSTRRTSGASVSMNESESAACTRLASGQPPALVHGDERDGVGDQRPRPRRCSREPAREQPRTAPLVVVDVDVERPVAAGDERRVRIGKRALDVVQERGDAQGRPAPGLERIEPVERAHGGARCADARSRTKRSAASISASLTASSPGATGARRARRPRSPTRCPAGRRGAPRAGGRARPAGAGRPRRASRGRPPRA